jgi:uncharacterized membrane protein
MVMNLGEYIQFIGAAAGSDNVSLLAKEAVERMRINVGLFAENTELKRKLKACEEGRPDWVGPPPYGT